jgi:hypothetical protein
VARRGEAGARPVSGGASGEAARGTDQGSAEAAGRRTWPDSGGGVRQRRSKGGREREVYEGGPGCKNQKRQGPHCNASTTFKPVLKSRWAQKKKCRVFQNVQLCFKVHLQKSNSFDTNTNLSKVFKLYVNPIDKTTLRIYPMCSFTYIYDLNTSF